jgi:hypothetical protein
VVENSAADKLYDEPSKADRFETVRTYFKILIEEEMPDCNAA